MSISHIYSWTNEPSHEYTSGKVLCRKKKTTLSAVAQKTQKQNKTDIYKNAVKEFYDRSYR